MNPLEAKVREILNAVQTYGMNNKSGAGTSVERATTSILALIEGEVAALRVEVGFWKTGYSQRNMKKLEDELSLLRKERDAYREALKGLLSANDSWSREHAEEVLAAYPKKEKE